MCGEGEDEGLLVATSQEAGLQSRVSVGEASARVQPGHSRGQPGLTGAIAPLQPAKAWLAVFLVSNDSRGLKGGVSGQAGQHCSCGL